MSGPELADGEKLLFEQRSDAQIPRGNGHKRHQGTMYVTNRRIVHDHAGLFGMGGSRHEIPMAEVRSVSTGSGMAGSVQVSTVHGHTTHFTLPPTVAERVAELIRVSHAEQ